MSKNTKLIIGIIIIIIIVGGIWYGVSRKPKEEEVVKVGAILPLSGQLAFLGNSELKGFELAVNEFNEESKDLKVELLTEDSKADPTEAVTALNKLINVDGSKIIFNSLSPTSSAIVPISSDKNVLTILVSVLSSSFTKQSDLVFKFYPDVTHFAEKISDHLKKGSIEKVALLIYNIEPGEIFIERFSSIYDGEIVGIERFNREDSEFRTQITKIKKTNPEAIIFIGYPTNDVFFLNQMVEMNFKIPIILQLANYPSVNGGASESLKILEPVSVWYTFLEESNKEFVNNYKNSFNIEPDAEAAYSYDAMKILLEAVNVCKEDLACIKNELKTKIWRGTVSETISFDDNGNAVLPVGLIKYDGEKSAREPIE